ncbi:hypothetical protein CPT_Mendera_175 [Stenotrophomonas phage Mendera]|uniref:Uncharacterized protein n=2 Tax=Menderavirus TaxID=2843421 RepID=A0A5P8PMK0_9CAUD|nr:hypothetical protein HWC58_gp229 [Stenotrophomonas phage Moby]YP_009851209.1 hypothetical protein HWC60_gp240 [Stenotrophomonas phage Mendera]QFR56701.1 hypothetical protein CPT_Mendera_175 [Stenotrophomonas phage Mendera]QFR57894.1 hypothetical protein CPT_Moby_169 [Stenotrophomonas phage Moby]
MARYNPLLSEQVFAVMQRSPKPLMTAATIKKLLGDAFSVGSVTQALHVLRCDGRVQSFSTKPFIYKIKETP